MNIYNNEIFHIHFAVLQKKTKKKLQRKRAKTCDNSTAIAAYFVNYIRSFILNILLLSSKEPESRTLICYI